MTNIKLIYYHDKGEKRKNNGISGGIVIRLRAYPKSSLQFLSIWYNRFIRQS